MNTKKVLLNTLPLLLIGTAMVYAAAPSGGYLPGATSDPACAPGDTDCFVQVPVNTDDQTLSLSGTALGIEDGNSVDLSSLTSDGKFVDGTNASDAVYTGGNVGIGTTTPNSAVFTSTHKGVDITNSSGTAVLVLNTFRDSINGGKLWSLKARGTEAAPEAILEGERMLEINGAAYNGTSYNTNTRIFMSADGAQTTTSAPSKIQFNTTSENFTSSLPRMVIKNSGNVGIGTESPGAKLDIKGHGDGVVDKTKGIRFGDELSGIAPWNFNPAGSSLYRSLTFYTTGWDGSAVATRDVMTIGGYNGNVGIGTTSPSEKLEVNGDIISGMSSNSVYGTNTIHGRGTFLHLKSYGDHVDTYNEWGFYNHPTSGNLFFTLKDEASSGNAENFSKMMISKDGNVGIGTTSPIQKLHIVDDADAGVNIQTTSDTETAFINLVTADTNFWLQNWGDTPGLAEDQLRFNQGTIAHMVINNDGNVGIGTTSPGSKLDVVNNGSAHMKLINTVKDGAIHLRTDTTGNAYINNMNNFADFTESGNELLTLTGQSGIRFNYGNIGASGTEVMRIHTNGNVGIGTASPSAKLNVIGSSAVYSDFATYDGITVNGKNPNGKDPTLVLDEAISGTLTPGIAGQKTYKGGMSFGVGGAGIYSVNPNPAGSPHYGDLRFHTTYWNGSDYNNADRMVIASDTGNVGIGTTNPGHKLEVSGVSSGDSSGIRMVGAAGKDAYIQLYGDRNWGITNDTDGSYGGDAGAFNIVDNTSGTSPRFTINNTGNVGIGTTSPSYKLEVNGSVAGVGAYVNTSDKRLKKDFVEIETPLDKLMTLKGLTFDWRRDENPEMEFPKGRDMGVIAQDVIEVFPEAVVQNDAGIFSVAYSKLIAPIIEAIRELANENDAQDDEIEKLKTENIELKARLLEIEKHISQGSAE